MRRLVLGLNAATVLLVIAGILLLVVPSPSPAGRTASPVASAGGPPDSARLAPAPDVGAADRLVRTDIFSARRSPPARRYAFGDTAQEPDVSPPDVPATEVAGEPVDSTMASTASDVAPHLYGTMLGSEATALLKLDASVSEPRLYHVGDRAGGYRVVEILDRQVTLLGPAGRVVLRLRASP